MALSSGMPNPISRMRETEQPSFPAAMAVLWSAFLALLVAGPWLAPGYLFGTDWPGPRHLSFPTDAASWAPLQALLAFASQSVGGELTGKLLIVGALLGAGATAFRALPVGGFVPRAAAATIYVVNPFVYGRLHYGQLFLLAGYAVLPWAALRLRELLTEPRAVSAIVAAISFGAVGVLSLHLFLVAAIFATAMVLAYTIAAADKASYLIRVLPSLFLTLVMTMAVSAYWVIPVLLGKGREGTTVAAIGSGDLRAYAAVADERWGLLPNVLGLYGFWAENAGRFASMKVFVPLWPLVLVVILAVAAAGTAWAFRQRRGHLGAWVAGLLVAAGIAVVLEMGVSSPVTRGLATWMDATIPIYRGMRDAGKWAGLLALVYSQLFGLGAAATIGWVRALPRPGAKIEWLGGVAMSLLLAVPLYYGNGVLFGMHAEIRPSQYPPGWYQADRVLAADGHPGRVLFLPWHEYMSYTFIQNENKVVASPAPTFFSVPVLVSADPEVPGITPPTDRDQLAISNLVHTGPQAPWAKVLATLGVKYVLVAHEVDWPAYQYLVNEQGLVKVADYGSIVLYRNNLET